MGEIYNNDYKHIRDHQLFEQRSFVEQEACYY